MKVKLSVLEGKYKGREIPLPETIFLIGRDKQCHLRPHCQGVSQLHCAIAGWAGQIRVRDLKSRNGTFLNGQEIQGEVVVKNGDELQVGTLRFVFRIQYEEESARIMPIKDERELAWLLDGKPESAVLQAATETIAIPKPNGTAQSDADALANTPGSKAISGGQHLQTYLQERKRRRPPL